MPNPLKVIAAAAAFACLSAPAYAHHSTAVFDFSKQAKLDGTVKAIEWVNPHIWIWVVSNEATPVTYGFETLNPGQLLRDYGWQRDSLKVGDKVQISYSPLKSGKPGGELLSVKMPNGKILETRFSRNAAGAAGAPPGDPPAAASAGRN